MILQFIIAGLVAGGLYAITAAGIVFTFVSTGVLNLAFGAMGYTVARCYFYLNTEHGWPILPAALLSILVLGPVVGVSLYALVFRFLDDASALIKIVVTIGISVVLPPLNDVIFGLTDIITAPGLAPQPEPVYHLIGVGISLDQIIVYACVAVILLSGFLLLRRTDVGLRIRANVDSPAMTSLAGTNPKTISLAVWAASSTLAGLVGVLVAPLNGLSASSMSLLMATALAAVIAGKLRSLPVAVTVGFAMGIANALAQYYLSPTSSFTGDFLEAIPLIVIVLSVLCFTATRQNLDDTARFGGALDRAIRAQGDGPVQANAGGARLGWGPSLFGLACLLALPILLHSFWIGLAVEGISYGIIALSFTVVTGEGGMIWLCQPLFVVVGATATELFATSHGVPTLAAIVLAGVVAVPFGAVVALLTVRMGNLYVALVTLTLGLFADNTGVIQLLFAQFGHGGAVNPPGFATGARALCYLCIGVFVVLSLLVVNLRRSTTGLALTAVRTSSMGAKTLGIRVVEMKVLVASFAAFIAGIGGAMLAASGSAFPGSLTTLNGELWIAVLVTVGIRSNAAAGLTGLFQIILPGLFVAFLSTSLGNLVPILFGLGAIAAVKFPDGVLTAQARRARVALALISATRPTLSWTLRCSAAVYVAVLVALLVSVRDLWWLWMAVTVFVAAIGDIYGYKLVANGSKVLSTSVPSVNTLGLESRSTSR